MALALQRSVALQVPGGRTYTARGSSRLVATNAPLARPLLCAAPLQRLPYAPRRPARLSVSVTSAAAAVGDGNSSGSQGSLASLGAQVARLLPVGVLGAAVGFVASSVAGLPAVLTAGVGLLVGCLLAGFISALRRSAPSPAAQRTAAAIQAAAAPLPVLEAAPVAAIEASTPVGQLAYEEIRLAAGGPSPIGGRPLAVGFSGTGATGLAMGSAAVGGRQPIPSSVTAQAAAPAEGEAPAAPAGVSVRQAVAQLEAAFAAPAAQLRDMNDFSRWGPRRGGGGRVQQAVAQLEAAATATTTVQQAPAKEAPPRAKYDAMAPFHSSIGETYVASTPRAAAAQQTAAAVAAPKHDPLAAFEPGAWLQMGQRYTSLWGTTPAPTVPVVATAAPVAALAPVSAAAAAAPAAPVDLAEAEAARQAERKAFILRWGTPSRVRDFIDRWGTREGIEAAYQELLAAPQQPAADSLAAFAPEVVINLGQHYTQLWGRKQQPASPAPRPRRVYVPKPAPVPAAAAASAAAPVAVPPVAAPMVDPTEAEAARQAERKAFILRWGTPSRVRDFIDRWGTREGIEAAYLESMGPAAAAALKAAAQAPADALASFDGAERLELAEHYTALWARKQPSAAPLVKATLSAAAAAQPAPAAGAAKPQEEQTIGMLLEAVFSGEGLEAFFGGLARWAGGEARALNEPSLKAASAAEAAPAQPRPAAGLAASGGPTLLSLLDFLVPQTAGSAVALEAQRHPAPEEFVPVGAQAAAGWAARQLIPKAAAAALAPQAAAAGAPAAAAAPTLNLPQQWRGLMGMDLSEQQAAHAAGLTAAGLAAVAASGAAGSAATAAPIAPVQPAAEPYSAATELAAAAERYPTVGEQAAAGWAQGQEGGSLRTVALGTLAFVAAWTGFARVGLAAEVPGSQVPKQPGLDPAMEARLALAPPSVRAFIVRWGVRSGIDGAA